MTTLSRLPTAPTEAMPELAEFLAPFRAQFARREGSAALERDCTGLLTEHPNKNCDTLAQLVPATSGQQLQGLLTAMSWDEDDLNRQRVERMLALPTEGDGVLIFDDTGFAKQGAHSVGVARQYSGTLGKTGNCQVAVTCHYAERTLAWPVAARLYLPRPWADDAALALTLSSAARADDKRVPAAGEKGTPRVLRIGAVAYAPSAVTVFENLRRYFAKTDLPVDYVLYSNYDSLVDALKNGHVDIAWNTPLAHARYHLSCDGKSQTLVMRDVDCNFRCKLLVRKESGIKDPAGLEGKKLALGSREAAEATVLPLHYLKGEGVKLDKVQVLHLDDELDLRGNPCSSPLHVLKALRAGRADAGFVGERLWDDLVARKAPEVEGLVAVWTSPSFSHCVFTAAKDFDKTRAARFTQLMQAMDGKDECTAEILRLEGASKWVAGSPDGFETLTEALKAEKGKGTGVRP